MEQYSREDIAEIKSRIGQIQEMLSVRSEERPVSDEGDPQTMLVEQVSFSLQTRRIRQDHFGRAQLSGANWDMMLDLMLAREQDRQLSASDLATGAGVPLSSGLRMIAALEQEGLVHRAIDEKDRRRSLIRLSDAGADRMKRYFETIRRAWNDRQRRTI
jgi:DNA-binding MarR family transcriptional regulator